MEHVEMIQLYPVEVWCNVPFFPARTPCEGAHVMLSVLPQRWLQMESRSAIWNMLIVYIYILPNSFLIVHICLYHMYIYIYTTWQFVSAVGKSLRWCKCLDDGFPSQKKIITTSIPIFPRKEMLQAPIWHVLPGQQIFGFMAFMGTSSNWWTQIGVIPFLCVDFLTSKGP
jgi:hypothetical protein